MLYKYTILQLLSIIVGIVGAAVMVGWILDIGLLKSILPIWVTMKFSTALSFFLSGITLFFINRIGEGDLVYAPIVLSGATLCLLLLMATLLISNIFGVYTGVEDLFVRESEGAVRTTIPGRPSVGTMVNFILIGMAGVITLFKIQNLNLVFSIFGWFVISTGCVALLGYTFNVPILYYNVDNWSTAMAVHTAILFVISGIGLVSFSRADGNSGSRQ